MAARKASSLGLKVDERTKDMSDAALFCRRYGHKWALQAMTPKRFKELVAAGLHEEQRYCENECGSTWEEIWDLYSGDTVKARRDYPKGAEYKMPQGTGRLNRKQARVAYFARRYRSLV